MDHEALKQHQRRIWSRGDYAALSDALRPAAVALCDACAVSAGQEVLDVAAGDGNFAIACAYEGASVVASDISPGMVERGRARAQAEGYDIEWVEADAEDLPFEDERFECAGSVFGAMIAPRPEVAARELFRVVRPGNTVGMTAWTPGSLMADYFAITRSYGPPEPDERPSSTEWGREEIVRERFDGLAASIEFERRTLTWEAESADGFTARYGLAAPPMDAAREALPPERFEAMVAEITELFRSRAGGGDGPLALEAEYALIVARRRG